MSIAVLVCAVSGTAARAQDQDPSPVPDTGPVVMDPGPACADAINQDVGCDTEFTPVAKDADEEVWRTFAGAKFRKEGELWSEAVPASVDFFTVRFQTPELGFAGGAACPDDTPFGELHDDYCGPSRAEGVPRVPVIYRYLDADGPLGEEPGAWSELYRGSSKGYVGAIAFMSPDSTDAIAVGGTGSYPRRELGRCEAGETPATDPDHCDGTEPPTGESDAHYAARDLAGEEPNAAGRARVWLYGEGDWHERTELPDARGGDPMRGFTAVDCSPRLTDNRRCLAGAYRQLWLWQGEDFDPDRSFTGPSGSGAPDEELTGALPDDSDRVVRRDRFRFRVRAVHFRPGVDPVAEGWPQAYAVTAGCCARSEALDQPWRLDVLRDSAQVVANEGTGQAGEAEGRRLAESLYALCFICSGPSAVAAPGRPSPQPPAVEPSSRVVRANTTAPLSLNLGVTGLVDEVTNPNLSTLRLVAGDGDFGAPPGSGDLTPQPTFHDDILDWAVGELTSSGQAAAYTTLARPTPLLDALDCPAEVGPPSSAATPVALTQCQLKGEESAVTGTTSKRLIGLPTYALNAFSYIPGVEAAWAAGDKGALLNLGGNGRATTAGDEPKPPRLGTRQPGQFGEGSAYEGHGAAGAGPVAPVPSLAARRMVELPEPALVPAGAPDPSRLRSQPREDVEQIVMSRDGTEGWAIGKEALSGRAITLFHYAGGRWTRCETDSVPGVLEADPACEALAPLRDAAGGEKPIGISMAARVPLERDGDPSNDDEFELVAISGPMPNNEPRLMLRYRDGRWTIDEKASGEVNVPSSYVPSGLVFSAPDEGWLTESFAGSSGAVLHHFDGEGWVGCDDTASCADHDSLLPLGGGPYWLTEAGGRVYLATSTATILYKDRGDGERWSDAPAQGGMGGPSDCVARNPVGGGCIPDRGARLTAISVAPAPGGGYTGWAVGSFPTSPVGSALRSAGADGRKPLNDTTNLLRLEPMPEGGATWVPWGVGAAALDQPLADRGDASTDYLGSANAAALTTPGGVGESDAWLVPLSNFIWPAAPILAFRAGRWQAAGTPFSLAKGGVSSAASASQAVPSAITPDGRGGYWLAVRQAGVAIGEYHEQTAFYHYTDRAPEPVFTEAPHPIREVITAGAGGPDGSFWVATASSTLYRYDRVRGWERVRVPGWDSGRTITRASQATAIAVGPGGEGLVVGEGGRIAELAPTGARLDAAAGAALCTEGAAGPCGTGRTLRAAAIEPNGAALVGGDHRALLWRSSGGAFHAIPPPPTTPDASITAISYPRASQAFLATDLGQVWVGDPSSANPGWRVENRAAGSPLLTSVDTSGNPLELRAIAVDSAGHGFAAGEKGLVLERTGDPSEPWRRIDEGLRDDFYSVALPSAEGGSGALIGGANGVIYTFSDGRLEVARQADPWDPLTAAAVTEPRTGRIVGLGMTPGIGSGEVEAWAVSQIPPGRTPDKSAVLHYTSDPDDSLLDPTHGASPLADVPGAREGEVTLAAFGRSECQSANICAEPQDSDTANDSVMRRVAEEIVARERASGDPVIAAFTGDVSLAAGSDGSGTPDEINVMHRRWTELVASRFISDRVPLFGALGVHDLSQVKSCAVQGCQGTQDVGVGGAGPWADAMRAMFAPWGDATLTEDGVSYVPVDIAGLGEPPLSGGARTHYALDVVRGDQKLLRLVVADNSMRSLQSSEPNQNPLETAGQGQWLEEVLCRSGEGSGCTRAADEPAVVMATTPTYSYGPGGLEHTASDAATFERTLLAHDVSALISGRLGWNGLYYTCAPQLHNPKPGDGYPEGAPRNRAECVAGEDASGLPAEPPDPNELLGQIGVNGVLPGVIAASAGGSFGPNRDEQGSAADGFWRGYTVVRVPADGDPSQVVVEQRPVFDWVSIRPAPGERSTHQIRAGKKLAMEGFGREVAGTDAPLRYDEITSAAITHRYDLLVADPDRPWLPKEDEGSADDGSEHRSAASTRLGEQDPCGPYLCLDPKVGTINDQSGEVRAGKGNYPRTYAVAALSVGDHAATYPLVFEPRASYRTPAQAPAAPVAVPPPPPPPAPAQPTTPTVNLPAAPVLPVLTAQALAPPPLPPSPPTFASEAPLDLNLSPAALDVTPPTAVTQPPTPPVNPAPPGGARKEARQRQAAAQKSGADSAEEEGSGDAQQLGGDMANAPDAPDYAATRTDHPFTAIADRSQPSAWARDLALGGGLGIAALILALGLGTARPTPRRRQPEVPAPARSYTRGRRF